MTKRTILVPTEELMQEPGWDDLRQLLLADDLSPREQRRLDNLSLHGELYPMELEVGDNMLRLTSDMGAPQTSLTVELRDESGFDHDDKLLLDQLMLAVVRSVRQFL